MHVLTRHPKEADALFSLWKCVDDTFCFREKGITDDLLKRTQIVKEGTPLYQNDTCALANLDNKK